jgi:hypothetical protein
VEAQSPPAVPWRGGEREAVEKGGDPGGGRRRRESDVEEGFAQSEHFVVPLVLVGCCASMVSVGEVSGWELLARRALG